eukprot:Gregarina_sp_Pseudo_9__1685@NODE_2139_length_1132_cov_39_679780_g1973_i0_p1_GENE_NODE_2139_length_1132_cov_39_679780_g1973_i0NODE_2139_length_1132_cov_39_679780_g1973_i0_p1_ORF_typecomplete_len340_score51_49IIGP/PF05049_13/7_5e02IIGP/PF05049_13/1_4e53MMR_HSR1/PF01926_23/7_1e08FeoB_N/PF02421_18/1_9e07WEMBL/PF05701_11/1_9e07JAKMIP_CC3/PF16034_5/1_7e06RsgA_GTPase/PF03193_16/4_7e05RsgA_GTPase/PF03193_16/83AAA_15/PF13175_6/6_1e02AAA_15/PF13175_6/0_0014Filament/PF00038_21/4_3e05GTP_EFTU/PF00009_27/0_0
MWIPFAATAAVAFIGLFGGGSNEANKGLERRINEATAENEKMKSELSQMQSKVATLNQQIAQQVAERSKVEAELKKAIAEVEKLQEAIKHGIEAKFSPTKLDIFRAKNRLRYKEGYFHIAIAGRSGTGKSSLLNALRALRNKDPKAAPVGHIETTMEITRYESPNPTDKALWYDIPGAGTLNIPRWDYFKNQCLYMFDAVILAWDNRLMDTDLAILTHCRHLQIPCFVVRSKCDQVLLSTREEIVEDLEDLRIFSTSSNFQSQFKSRYEPAVAKFRRETKACFDNLCKKNSLPPCVVYLVSARCLYRVLKGDASVSRDPDELDEISLVSALRVLEKQRC